MVQRFINNFTDNADYFCENPTNECQASFISINEDTLYHPNNRCLLTETFMEKNEFGSTGEDFINLMNSLNIYLKVEGKLEKFYIGAIQDPIKTVDEIFNELLDKNIGVLVNLGNSVTIWAGATTLSNQKL